MVIPAELPYLLVWWKRGPGGLEGLAFIQVALGVQRRALGVDLRGSSGLVLRPWDRYWFLTSSRKGVITSQGLDVDDLETITKVLASTIHIFGMSLVLDTRI